nr:receptor-like protein kinase FERONIA [Ipomoea batatas]GMD09474.1 receptor-like protein kinase FERONIA [Ipomoea batatas]
MAISCGSSGTSTAPDGRVWVGDNTKLSSILLHLNGVSWTSRAQQKASLMIDPVPYQTARTSRHEFSYRFSVKPGQKIIRLHFNPAPYKGFKKSIALFTVKAGPYTLLSNFSPSLTADALGVKFLNKEYCVNVQDSEALTIIFTPSQETKSSEDVYAFVNGIEIVSMPTGLYFTPEGDLGAHVVGQKHRFYIDTATALQMIKRLNVGGQSIPSIEDVSMFRDWKDDFNYLLNGVGAASIDTTIPIEYADMLTDVAPPKVYQTARSVHPGNQQLIVHNLTWIIPVNLGFRYLVRLHFCEFEPEISARGERQFSILINNQIAEYNADVIKWSGGNGIAVYKDYIAMMEGDRMKGTGTLVISLQPNSEFSTKRTDGILNGLEIFKLSNPDNYLVGMNPVPQHKQSSVSEMPHRQRPVFFDRKSAIVTAFTVAVTLLNIAIYYLRCLSEANSNMRNTRSRCTDPACRQFSLEEIQLSTSNFSPEFLIGRGGYGNVYKGTIHGRRCLRKQPHERPDMADVLTNLELVLALLQKEGVEDEVMSIESVCSDGVISFDELCEDPLAENMENPTTEATSYKGKGKGKDISKGKVKKDSTFKTNASIRWWDFLWFQPKQSPKTKTSPTQPRIPKQSSKKKVSSMQLQGGLHRFSLQEIQQATDNFNQSFIIGLGEADKVYIGFLNGGENIVAIRRASTAYSIRCMAHELQSKLDNLPLPNHANVLSLIGYCNPDAEMILVYSRWGFLDSDYVRDTTSTEKSYAYAFGLLLIEVLCANNELILWDQDRESIASLFKSCIEGSLSRCIDPYLIGKISPDCLRMFVDTASSCLQDQGSKRPSLSEVVKNLKAALELQEAADGNNKGF